MAAYLTNLLWNGYQILPESVFLRSESTLLLLLTTFALLLTYLCHLQRSMEAHTFWSWTHLFNCCLFFANAWSVTMYWNMLRTRFEMRLDEHYHLERGVDRRSMTYSHEVEF